MLSQTYFDTYKQYKAGTSQIIQWLVDTTGYVSKKQRKPHNTATDHLSIPPNVLPQLATQAVCCIAPLQAPLHILNILRHVIAARKECALQHRHTTTGLNNAQSGTGDGHCHFISILQEVQHVLLQTSSDAVDAKHSLKSWSGCAAFSEDIPKALVNRFEALELQEPEEWPSQHAHERQAKVVPLSQQKKRSYSSAPKINIADLDTTEEGIFAGFCFLMDYQKIRRYVQALWKSYGERRILLVAASITTNMAFDAVHQLHFELSTEFPSMSTYETLTSTLLDHSLLPGLVDAHQTIPGSDVPRACQIEQTMPGREAISVLEHFKNGYVKGVFRDFHPDDDDFDWATQWRDFLSVPSTVATELLLVRAIPDVVCFLENIGGINSPMDEFSCNFLDFYHSHTISVPLVLMCDIFVDIQFVLLSDVERPRQELLLSAKRAESTIKRAQVHAKVLEFDPSFDQTKQTLSSLQAMIHDTVNSDAVAEFRQNHVEPVREHLTEFYLLRHHPTMCGMLQFHIDRAICYGGLRLCNEWRCLMGVIHLYNALQQSGLLSIDWPDMDAVVTFYGAHYLFVGDTPASSQQWAKRYALAMGAPPSAFASNARSDRQHGRHDGVLTTMRVSKTSGRLFEVEQPQTLLTIMRKRFSQKKGKRGSDMVFRDVEIALQALERNAAVPDDKSRTFRERNERRARAPVEMLQAILRKIQSEELHLQFNFLAFNVRCIEFLRRLRDRMMRTLPDAPWSELTMSNESLEAVVTVMFDLLEKNDDMGRSMLSAAGESLTDIIQREGAKEVEAARLRIPGMRSAL